MAKRQYFPKHTQPVKVPHGARHYNASTPIVLPPSVDLRRYCSPIRDQGNEGACTGFATTGVMMCVANIQSEAFVQLSEQFVYFNERKTEGDIGQDGGAQISTGIQVLEQLGACEETFWPYTPQDFTQTPTAAAYANALKHKALSVEAVEQTEDAILHALASGFPIVGGISVYESFESDEVMQTGIIPLPSAQEQCLGGHAIAIVGYDRNAQTFILRNSWGTGIGLNGSGYFSLPFQYFLDPDLASDLWCITKVS